MGRRGKERMGWAEEWEESSDGQDGRTEEREEWEGGRNWTDGRMGNEG